MPNFLSNTAIALIVFYLLLLIIFYKYQTKLLLHPDKQMLPIFNKSYEICHFRSGNFNLHGLLSQKFNHHPMVLFSHGNAGNLSHRVGVMNMLEYLKLNFFIYDYRGFGLSEGQINSEQDLYDDGLAAWKFLVEHRQIDPKNIIIWGRSLGAAIACQIALQHPQAKALVLDCPFSNIVQVGSYHYPFLPISLLSNYRMDNLACVKNIRMPIVISHSPSDRIIPFSLGKDVYKAANQPKLFITLSGDHNDGFENSFANYTNHLKIFLEQNNLMPESDPNLGN